MVTTLLLKIPPIVLVLLGICWLYWLVDFLTKMLLSNPVIGNVGNEPVTCGTVFQRGDLGPLTLLPVFCILLFNMLLALK